ncbi:MAG: hypothetical protein H6745_15580 [Deltaproteobacteria bacterium]|nr:hypothetical protein [Deltaproteobacteria bacterium]
MLRHVVSAALLVLVVVGAEASPAAAADPCALEARCAEYGHCSPSGGTCLHRSDADCLQGCQRTGDCAFDAKSGFCTVAKAGCAKSPACKQFGACDGDVGTGECHGTDAACAAATIGCKVEGACGPIGGVQQWACVADEASCRRSERCATFGECGVQDDGYAAATCVATTTKDCMASRACKRDGACQRDEASKTCAATEGGCKRSLGCRELGLCALAPEKGAATLRAPGAGLSGCWAGDDAACAAAAACTSRGACSAYGGVCASRAGLAPPTCEVVEITGLVVTASSEHKATPPYRFEAALLVDRDLRTSWQPASKKGGVGEKLTIRLPRAATLTRLEVAPGFQLRDGLGDLWLMNNRPRQLAVRAGGVTVVAPVADAPYGTTPVPLPPVEADVIEIEVVAVEKGTRWNDLAISELRVYACE